MDLKTLKQTVFYSIIALIVIGMVIVMVLEIPSFERTLQLRRMLLLGAGVGSVIGIFVGLMLTKTIKDSIDKVRIILMLLVFCLITVPTLLSISNRLLSSANRIEKVEFFDQKGVIADLAITKQDLEDLDFIYTFVVLDGELIRIKSVQPLFPNHNRGDHVDLTIIEGFWGFDVIQID